MKTITTYWLDGYDRNENSETSIHEAVLEQEAEYGVTFNLTDNNNSIYRGIPVEVSGEPADLKRWWIYAYNGNADGYEVHNSQWNEHYAHIL